MEMKRLTRKQIREHIASTPLEEILHVPVRALTTKQRDYCKRVASGKPFNQSYREAYQSKANPKSIGVEVNHMNKDPRIILETEAQKRAIEFEKSYSARQLKSIVISQLTKEALNPSSKPSERISALKALGSVAELGVFVERKEIRTIKDSSTAKADLLDKLRKAIKDQSRTIDADAMSLLDEINSYGAMQQENSLMDEALAADPLPTDPPNSTDADSNLLHTNPLKQSQNKVELASGKQSPIENDSQQTERESEKS
jgi:hypothetical protein